MLTPHFEMMVKMFKTRVPEFQTASCFMRDIIDSLHAIMLRLLGAIGILYFLAILAGIPVGLALGRHIGSSIAVGFAGAGVCLFLAVPRMTPPWLRRPEHPGHGLTILLAMFAVQIFVFAPMAGIAVAGFDLPVSSLPAYMTAAVAPSVAASLMVVATGLVLGNWRDPAPGRTMTREEEVRPNIVGLRGAAMPNPTKG
ncbi:hypothetical protein [Tropicimonas sediminicola]|uniref:Uncharacterized protein n=1 Tax=Tropicimonas sediminicola TaxID=1031541 RepID=A0A239EKW5_9RHOB|nr:hypothetical protein [Tropicimonas sediminicola]SNS45410.1 hypothetical protein SAMN05421757_102215 [Tropicimonas sediminicola]